MTADSGLDVAHFRQRLQQRRAELQQMRASGAEAAQPVELDQSRVGRLSRMDALQGQAMSLQAERRREQELARIVQALQRLQQGDYGECLHCGELIASGRLEIDPAATLCIRCAEQEAGA